MDATAALYQEMTGMTARNREAQLSLTPVDIPLLEDGPVQAKVTGDALDVFLREPDVPALRAAVRASRLAFKPEVELSDLDRLAHGARTSRRASAGISLRPRSHFSNCSSTTLGSTANP